MSAHVLIPCRQLQSCIDQYRGWLADHGITIELPPIIQHLTEDDLVPIIGRFDAIIAGDDQVSRKVIKAGTRLKVICKWGIGIDAIDVAAAAERNIPVYNTPGMFGEEVADMALGYIILLARPLHLMDRGVRDGVWTKLRGTTLSGLRVGVVGLGSIGRAVVRRLGGFGLVPLGCDPYAAPDPQFDAQTGLTRLTLAEMLPQIDYLVVTCNLTPDSFHLINADALARLKKGAKVINVSRGPVIDEKALVEALRTGHVGGAGLDVFEEEPLPTESPLRGFDNVILGAHNGSNTHEGVDRVNVAALRNLLRGLGIAEKYPPASGL